MNSAPYIAPPARIRWWLRALLWVSDSIAGKELRLPRLMAWSPKVALTSGILEAGATRPEGNITPRLLKLLRLQVSLRASCAFCFDMNAAEYEAAGVTTAELAALQKLTPPQKIRTLSAAEQVVLRFALEITATPIAVQPETANGVRRHFSEREYLLIVATCAQVNYWARLAQGLGVPPEGFASDCSLP